MLRRVENIILMVVFVGIITRGVEKRKKQEARFCATASKRRRITDISSRLIKQN